VSDELARRLDSIESRLAIGQLPIRYAMAVDGRDLDAWVGLFVPDVRVGRDSSGRDALRAQIDPVLRTFRRSMHQIVGHRVDLDPDDPHRASGATYCRAEHEVDDRWIVMAICYFDQYRRVDGQWFFERRKERHWYAVDHLERPQSVDFGSWPGVPQPALPDAFATWSSFWDSGGAS
jgi:SnoaL-like domain